MARETVNALVRQVLRTAGLDPQGHGATVSLFATQGMWVAQLRVDTDPNSPWSTSLDARGRGIGSPETALRRLDDVVRRDVAQARKKAQGLDPKEQPRKLTKPLVRHIRPSDPGYGSRMSKRIPWLCVTHVYSNGDDVGMGFGTIEKAQEFARLNERTRDSIMTARFDDARRHGHE